MTQERVYVVLPASVIREHAITVTAPDVARARQEARKADPSLDQERVAIVPTSVVHERGGEMWGPR